MALLQRLDETEPDTVSKALAASRIAIGVAGLVAPRALTRPLLRAEVLPEEAVTTTRMAAGRDVCLGLGALLAARRGPGAVRGWLEAAALADAVDAAAFAGGRGLQLPARVAGSALAAAAAALGVLTAQRLAD